MAASSSYHRQAEPLLLRSSSGGEWLLDVQERCTAWALNVDSKEETCSVLDAGRVKAERCVGLCFGWEMNFTRRMWGQMLRQQQP